MSTAVPSPARWGAFMTVTSARISRATPWTQLRLTVKNTSATPAASSCAVTHSGQGVAPVAASNSTSYLFTPAAGSDTEVVLSC